MKKYNEIRLRHGKLDDIVISDGYMHLKKMTENEWLLGFYKGKKRMTFWISSNSPIRLAITEDELVLPLVEQCGTCHYKHIEIEKEKV